jgi:hypothetical protein
MRPGDEPGMLEVLASAFDGWPRFEVPVPTLEHLRWQLQGYLQQEQAHFVSDVDGRIAALDMGYIRRFKVRDRELSVWVGTDGATHQDFQGRGLYSKVRKFRQDETQAVHDLMLSQTTNPVISRLYDVQGNRVGWGNRITLLLRVLDGGRVARTPGPSSVGIRGNALVRRLIFATMELLGSLRSGLHKSRDQAWTIRRADAFDERFDAFWQRAATGFDFIGERTPAFLSWRYGDARAGDYMTLVAEAGSEVLGYIVLRSGRDRGSIMDLLTLPGREDVVDALIAAALRHFRQAGCSAVQFITVARHPYNRVLRESGFFDARRKVDFYCAALRLDRAKLAFLENKRAVVHLTDGDMV